MMELKYHGNKIWESVYKSGLKDNKLMLEVYKAIRTHLPSGSFLVLFSMTGMTLSGIRKTWKTG